MVSARRIVQGLCLALVIVGVFVVGADCERWCPFGGVEALATYVVEGNMLCSLAVSNFFILGGVLSATLLVRRAFCGYMCPIGTISEWLHALGRRLRLPLWTVSGRTDGVLRWFKYLVLALLLILTYRAGELIFRGFDPCYALISRHGEDITWWAYVVSGLIAIGSMFVIMPFCRWFCPLAAVLNWFSRFGWTRIERGTEDCSDCGRCARRCPMAIPVDQVQQVTHARCMSCWECVRACPTGGARRAALSWGPRFPGGRRWPQWSLLAILLACTLSSVAASYLIPVPSFLRERGVASQETATVSLRVEDLTCRGRANLFAYFLERTDEFAVDGYLRIAAWPHPDLADVEIRYDPRRTDERAIRRAITEPLFEPATSFWRPSPFRIEGYDPWDVDELDAVMSPTPVNDSP